MLILVRAVHVLFGCSDTDVEFTESEVTQIVPPPLKLRIKRLSGSALSRAEERKKSSCCTGWIHHVKTIK